MLVRFLEYIEIRTKITSVFAFLMTIAYLFYREQQIEWKRTAVFFLSMFLFDLTTTAINNYIDTKTNGMELPFKRRTALLIIYFMFVISALLGMVLVFMTDVVVFAVGGLCFLIGVLYTYGPIPISRLPLGEALSGISYGLFIPFQLLYINMPHGTYLTFGLGWDKFTFELLVWPLLTIGLLSIAPVCVTANIMLGNNICDVQRDILVKRFTLPYYLGRKANLLFAGIYYLAYASIIAMAALDILPVITLASLLTIPFVQRNINRFVNKQEKSSTFSVSIRNFLLIMGSETVLIVLGRLVH